MATGATTHSCPNCGDKEVSRFCPQCGQKKAEELPSVGEMLHEVLAALFSYDGKLWRTIRVLVTSPGKLSLEYVAGRRASYVGPFQLFLWLQAIAFGVHRLLFSSEPGVADRKSLAILTLGIVLSVVVWILNFKRLKNYTHALLICTHVWAFIMFWLVLEYGFSVPVASQLVRLNILHGNVPVGQFVTLSTMMIVTGYLFVALKKSMSLTWMTALFQVTLSAAILVGAMVPLAPYL